MFSFAFVVARDMSERKDRPCYDSSMVGRIREEIILLIADVTMNKHELFSSCFGQLVSLKSEPRNNKECGSNDSSLILPLT